MTPLMITARLGSSVAPGGPLLLDGILTSGMGARLNRTAVGGYADAAGVYAAPLPLARVELPDGRWWYAASQATPEGPEAVVHAHRRPSYEAVERWTSAGSLNHSAGPDKALRIPVYTRPGWHDLRWTCVGDKAEIAALLGSVSAIGKRGAHGYGWVIAWDVSDGGPELDAYRTDPTLRHVPVDIWRPTGAVRVRRVDLPLTPPYHQRARGVACWQVPEVRHDR